MVQCKNVVSCTIGFVCTSGNVLGRYNVLALTKTRVVKRSYFMIRRCCTDTMYNTLENDNIAYLLLESCDRTVVHLITELINLSGTGDCHVSSMDNVSQALKEEAGRSINKILFVTF